MKMDIESRVSVLESQMADVRDDIKSIRRNQTWLTGLGWLIFIAIAADMVRGWNG